MRGHASGDCLAPPGWWHPISVLILTQCLGILFNYLIGRSASQRRTVLSIVSRVDHGGVLDLAVGPAWAGAGSLSVVSG